MKVVTEAGAIELGDVETAPTIGIIDRSRRVTDDFGVTTVVQRGFSRQLQVKLAVPFDEADGIQRQLAALRATSATWIADDRYGSLTVHGFYKEFAVDHAIPPLSYCSLTVEGLTGEEAFVDDGSDPAPAGEISTLQLLQPIEITDAVLTSSSVAEDDAIEWTAAGGYSGGQRVISRATHRVYESLIARNIGNDPLTTTGAWLDVGSTNRWAMFDQAIGSTTSADSPISVTLRPGPKTTGLAILDTTAASVRVQASGYDRMIAITDGSGAALFLDLVIPAGGSVTITLNPRGKAAQREPWDDGTAWADTVDWRDTIAGTATAESPAWNDTTGWKDTTGWQDAGSNDGTVSIGTLLIGTLRPLGITEGSASSGITDYSRRETDDFGELAIVPRAWSKRMAAKALIRTDAVDQVVGRVAAVRALPSLWLGDASMDSLTVYGFFKEFSVEVGETLSKLSLSIEGFSAAAKAKPLGIPWKDVTDPDGDKPTNNADNTGENTSKDTEAVAGVPAGQVIADAASVQRRAEILETVTIPAINNAVAIANALIKTAGEKADAALADLNRRLLTAGIAVDAALAYVDQKLVLAAVAADLASAAANARIDSAMTELNAEADRAKGADELLERRIDVLTVTTNKNDAEVRAAIETERLVRSDDVRSIARRIDSVITDYTSRDATTNTRITTQVTALSAADKALGERIDTVTTDYTAKDTATNTRITQSVSALSDADTAIGKRIDSVVTQVTTNDTATKAEIGRVELASSTRDTALGQRIDTVTAEYKGLDSATNTRITTQVTALSAADQALGERVDTVVTDYRAKDAATNTRITQTITALSDADTAIGKRIDSVTAQVSGNDTATKAEISRVETASSTRDTALGQRIDTVTAEYKGLDAATNTRVTTQVTALTSADQALGGRIDAVTTDYKAKDSATNTRISQTATALSDADVAIGQRIDAVTADYASRDSKTNARVDATVSAMADADRALGQRVDTLSATVSGADAAASAEISRVERASADRDIALGQRSDTINASLADARSRLLTVESATTDGRFATAQRVANLEAQVAAGPSGGDITAQIDQRLSVVVDPKIGAVTQSVTNLTSDYNGTKATVQSQAGTIVDLQGKATAYIRLKPDAGNGIAQFDLWSDQYGGAWKLTGKGEIGGDTRFTGRIDVTTAGANGTVKIDGDGLKVYYANGQLAVQVGI